jgi:hypothetical protein
MYAINCREGRKQAYIQARKRRLRNRRKRRYDQYMASFVSKWHKWSVLYPKSAKVMVRYRYMRKEVKRLVRDMINRVKGAKRWWEV